VARRRLAQVERQLTELKSQVVAIESSSPSPAVRSQIDEISTEVISLEAKRAKLLAKKW